MSEHGCIVTAVNLKLRLEFSVLLSPRMVLQFSDFIYATLLQAYYCSFYLIIAEYEH